MVSRKYLILLSMLGFLVAADQLTKNFVAGHFHLGETKALLENFFNITRVHNRGVAFGLLTTLSSEMRDSVFFLVPGLTLLAIFFVFYRLRAGQTMSIYALSMIIGGALGNLVDRFRLGYVIDFLDFHWHEGWHFPAFNVADMGVTCGVGLLLFGMLTEKEGENPRIMP